MITEYIQSFPTTFAVVDDDLNYLRGLSTILPKDSNLFRFFTNPKLALDWINEPSKKSFLPIQINDDSDTLSRRFGLTVELNTTPFEEPSRFDEVSAVIVDYDMPGINGVDFCRSIKNTNIQKILLTGFLDEKKAREALNKGWIDMFLPKGEDCSSTILEIVHDANSSYFDGKNRIITDAIGLSKAKFFEESLIRSCFEKVKKEFSYVEYHLIDSSGDYLFCNDDGGTFGMSLQDKDRRRENIELSFELDVPKNIQEKLISEEYIFCSYDDKELPSKYLWKDYIFPCDKIDSHSEIVVAKGREIFSKCIHKIAPFKEAKLIALEKAIKALS